MNTFKTIAIALSLTISATSASAGFWDVLTGKQSVAELQQEYNDKQIAYYTKAFENTDKVVLTDTNNVYVNIAGVVTQVAKSQLKGSKDQNIAKIKELVGNEVAISKLEEAVSEGALSEADLAEATAQLEAGVSFDNIDLGQDFDDGGIAYADLQGTVVNQVQFDLNGVTSEINAADFDNAADFQAAIAEVEGQINEINAELNNISVELQTDLQEAFDNGAEFVDTFNGVVTAYGSQAELDAAVQANLDSVNGN